VFKIFTNKHTPAQTRHTVISITDQTTRQNYFIISDYQRIKSPITSKMSSQIPLLTPMSRPPPRRANTICMSG